MSDGANEPIQFTRGDAERLAVVERDICHVKKTVNRMLKILYVGGVGAGSGGIGVIVKLIYGYVNGGG